MSRYSELAKRLERMWGPHGLIKEAAAALRELEAERDQWQQRCEKAWRVLDQEFGVRIASVYNGPLQPCEDYEREPGADDERGSDATAD